MLWDFKSSCFLWHGNVQGSPCARSCTSCSEPSEIFRCEAIPPSSCWSRFLHRWLVPQLLPRSPGLGCSSRLRALGRDTRLVLARLWRCLSQQPRSVLSLLPSWSQFLSPAQMEQRCLFSRQAARTSYSHQTRCQLRRLGRYSSALPAGCRKTSAGSFHVLLVTWLGLPLLSPIAVPPAKVQGTFLLITCKPASSSHSLFCYSSFAKGTHSSDSKLVVEKGPEGSGHHLDGRCGRAAGDKGDTTLMALTRKYGELGFVSHTSRPPPEMSDRGDRQPCFSEHLPAEQSPCGRRGGVRGRGEAEGACTGHGTRAGGGSQHPAALSRRGLSLCRLGKGRAHAVLSRHRSLPRHLLFFPPHCSLTFEHFNLVAFVSVTAF